MKTLTTQGHEPRTAGSGGSAYELDDAMAAALLRPLTDEQRAALAAAEAEEFAQRRQERIRPARVHDGLCACTGAGCVLGVVLVVGATLLPTDSSWAFFIAGLGTLGVAALCFIFAVIHSPEREVR